MAKKILLTQGLYALVDDEDFEYLNQFKWHVVKCKNGFYAARHERGKTKNRQYILMHREILRFGIGRIPQVDHKNRTTLDNQKENLRPSTQSQNRANSIVNVTKLSRYRGVCKIKDKWRAGIMHNKKFFFLGLFSDEVSAAKIYDNHAKEIYGEFATLNFKEAV